MKQFCKPFQAFLADERGATTVEYVAIASGLGLALVAALGGSEGALREAIELITSEVKAAAPTVPTAPTN